MLFRVESFEISCPFPFWEMSSSLLQRGQNWSNQADAWVNRTMTLQNQSDLSQDLQDQPVLGPWIKGRFRVEISMAMCVPSERHKLQKEIVIYRRKQKRKNTWSASAHIFAPGCPVSTHSFFWGPAFPFVLHFYSVTLWPLPLQAPLVFLHQGVSVPCNQTFPIKNKKKISPVKSLP